MADILTRIRKLLSLAQNNPSQAEAANAAAQAAEMMFKYQIQAEDLEAGETRRAEEVTEDTVDTLGARKAAWKGILLRHVAEAFGCHVWSASTSAGTIFRCLGTVSAVQTVSYIYSYLLNEIEELAERAWTAEANARVHGKTWKNSFRLGAVQVIGQRLHDQKLEQERRVYSMRQEAKQTSSMALVVHDEEQQRVEAAYQVKKKSLRSVSHRHNTTQGAYQQGESAGRSVQFSGGHGLGAAPRQLKD